MPVPMDAVPMCGGWVLPPSLFRFTERDVKLRDLKKKLVDSTAQLRGGDVGIGTISTHFPHTQAFLEALIPAAFPFEGLGLRRSLLPPAPLLLSVIIAWFAGVCWPANLLTQAKGEGLSLCGWEMAGHRACH